MTLSDDELQERIARFHVFDPDIQADPFPLYNEIRERCPVGRSEQHGGHWIVSRYEDVEAVMRNWQDFSSRQVLIPHFEHFYGEQIPLELDPPEHTKFRQALSPLFGPPRIKRIEPLILETAERLVGEIAARDSFEVMSSFANPLPSETFLHSFDIPATRIDELLGFKERLIRHGPQEGDPDFAQKRSEILSFFTDLIEQRRAEGASGDDVISELLRAEVDGRPWTDEEIVNAAVVLMLASLDTTSSALGLMISHLAERPELRARIVAEPAIIPAAIEEFMRWEHLLHNGRVLTRDLEIRGVQMKAGERIMMLFGAAQRDPRMYDDPEAIDFDRVGLKHMAFGVGPHRCLGNHLARATLRIALEEFHAAIPNYSVKPGTEPARRETYVRGVNELHLVPC
jgi:cytochrome P450